MANNKRFLQSSLLSGAMLFGCLTAVPAARASDLIVSAQDGKFVRVDGASTYPQPAPPDSLAVIDAEQKPPKIVALVEGVSQTVQGPPQSVAITPDGRLAFVGSPSHFDVATSEHILDHFIQVVDLTAAHPAPGAKIDLGVQVNGLSISPDGSMLLAAGTDGFIYVLTINNLTVTYADKVKVSDQRLASVSFTHDGRSAIVSMRDHGGAAILTIEGKKVSFNGERVSTGIAPYTVDVSGDNKWAVISCAGFAGLPNENTPGDADTIAVIDTSVHPFKTVQYLTVPSTPESVTISTDGRWIVAQSLNGSNLSRGTPGFQSHGLVTLFKLNGQHFEQVNQIASGVAAQGVIFAKDNRTLFVQDDVEKKIEVLAIVDGKLTDTGKYLPLTAGPVAIRSQPR